MVIGWVSLGKFLIKFTIGCSASITHLSFNSFEISAIFSAVGFLSVNNNQSKPSGNGSPPSIADGKVSYKVGISSPLKVIPN